MRVGAAMPLVDAAGLLAECGCDRVLVSTTPLTELSDAGVVRALTRRPASDSTAAEAARIDFPVIERSAPVDEAIRLMIRHNRRSMIAVDEFGGVVGMVRLGPALAALLEGPNSGSRVPDCASHRRGSAVNGHVEARTSLEILVARRVRAAPRKPPHRADRHRRRLVSRSSFPSTTSCTTVRSSFARPAARNSSGRRPSRRRSKSTTTTRCITKGGACSPPASPKTCRDAVGLARLAELPCSRGATRPKTTTSVFAPGP